jgi:hypothetical protein
MEPLRQSIAKAQPVGAGQENNLAFITKHLTCCLLGYFWEAFCLYAPLLTFLIGKLRQRWSWKEVMAWTAVQVGQNIFHLQRGARLTQAYIIEGYHAYASGWSFTGQVSGIRKVPRSSARQLMIRAASPSPDDGGVFGLSKAVLPPPLIFTGILSGETSV